MSVIPIIPWSESGGSSSTTKSVIATGNVVITDPNAQMAKTGQSAPEAINSFNRDTENAHTGALPQNQSIQGIVGTHNLLNKLAGDASKGIKTITNDISTRLAKMAKDNNDEANAAKWGKGGLYSTALDAAGTLIEIQHQNEEGLNTALGMLAGYLTADKFRKFTSEATKNITDPVEKAWLTNTLHNAILRVSSIITGDGTGGNSTTMPSAPRPDILQLMKEFFMIRCIIVLFMSSVIFLSSGCTGTGSDYDGSELTEFRRSEANYYNAQQLNDSTGKSTIVPLY